VKTLLELDPNDCRFPFGDENFTFCGKPKHLYLRAGAMCQSSYCREHHLICTQSVDKKKLSAA
jgi:hypothetical protein